jgi:uncharacterized protein
MNFVPQSNAPSRNTRREAPRRVFLKLCVGAAAATLAEGLTEPFTVQPTRFELTLPGLPPALDGLKVAQLTDPHRGNLTPDAVIQAAVRHIAAWQPDLVVLTGDYVRWDPADTLPFARFLEPLRPRLGLVGILGNHDYQDPHRVARILSETAGVQMLRNASAELAPGLFVAGIEDTWQGAPDPAKALQKVPGDAGLLFLTHNPVGVRCVTDRVCLALAGHTHGGQFRVPGIPPHFPPGMEGFSQIDGWGSYDKARLYVSRGVGCTAYPIRINCPPEVTLFVLRAA